MWTIAGKDMADVFDDYELDTLLNELYRQMFIVAYSMVRNKTDAMDIVQESWLKILQKTDSLRDEKKLVQWAEAVATNTRLNLMKKKYRQNASSLEQISAGELVRSDEDLEELLLLRKIIWESLDLLPEDMRRILVYKFFHRMKDKDIAEKLQMPIGTVKAKIHRAKIRMRAHLSETKRFPEENEHPFA